MSEQPWVGSTEAVELSGVSYRQMDHWVRQGWVHARETGRTGSGVPRQFSQSEVAVLTVMGLLVKSGFGPESAAPLARQLAETGSALLAERPALRLVLHARGVTPPPEGF